MPLVIPATGLLTIEAGIFVLAGLDLGNNTVPFVNQLGAAVFLAIWAVLLFWASWESDSIRRTISRTCWALSIALFLIPIAMIAYEVTAPPDPPDPIFPRWMVLAVISFFAVALGPVVLLLAIVMSPRGAAERSPERLFQETKETVRRIGMWRIALALMLLILGAVVLRVGSTSGFWGEKYTSITTNRGHTCGVRTDGTAHCWGDFRFGAIPPPDERFVAIEPGVGHACGLREDGSVSCWGDVRTSIFNWAILGIETSQGPFAEISNGGRHICGLRTDGTVECWGGDPDGYGHTSPPAGERFTEISAGRSHTCGIRPDGTGVCWGSIDSPTSGEQFKAISSGGRDFACGIRAREDVICWGPYADPTGLLTIEGPFVALSSGNRHTCGLRPDGSVHCWGASSAHDTHNFGSDPVRGERFVSISSGDNYNCGLRQNGSVKCWGGNWLDERYR